MLTREAARLMVEEEVKQYFVAKRLAAKRLTGRGGSRAPNFRPRDLPSNGEIHDAVLELVKLTDGHLYSRRLFALRVVAWEAMRDLAPFAPRLIGSVSTGHVRRGSDIDLHVFADRAEALETHIFDLGWAYEQRTVTIRKGETFRDYIHFDVEHVFPLELSVYQWNERRVVQRSSTDGKPIQRLKPEAVLELLRTEHEDEWADYQRTGVIPDLELLEQEQALPCLESEDSPQELGDGTGEMDLGGNPLCDADWL